MKPFKMLGLAALVALMSMAFLGTTSAMAESTALCTEDEETCAEENIALHIHLLGQVKLLTSLGTFTCHVLFLGGTQNGGRGAPLRIQGSFSYSSCGTGCTFTEENGPAELEVLNTGHETAEVVEENLVHVNCAGLNCRYTGVGLEGTGKGPLLSEEENGEIFIEEQTLNKESGTFCPSTTKIDLKISFLIRLYFGR